MHHQELIVESNEPGWVELRSLRADETIDHGWLKLAADFTAADVIEALLATPATSRP